MKHGLRQTLLDLYGLAIPDERWRVLAPRLSELGPRRDWGQALSCEAELRRAVLAIVAVDKPAFFRDPALFRFLEDELLPELIEEARPQAAQLWCAGCSRGHEPYSLALIAAGLAPRLGAPPPAILATDIRADVLAAAREARYPQEELAAIPRELRPAGERIPEGAKALVRFAEHRLGRQEPPRPETGGPWDLILCRNVMIYFPPELFCAAVRSLAEALRPGGLLVLGACEMLREESALFDCLLRDEVFVYRKKA